jgi:hypothetical protein
MIEGWVLKFSKGHNPKQDSSSNKASTLTELKGKTDKAIRLRNVKKSISTTDRPKMKSPKSINQLDLVFM